MSPHEITEYCKEKQRQYDEHMAESKLFRDKMTIVEGSLGWLVKAIDACNSASLSVKISLMGIVFAIIVQIGGFLYLWGRLNYNVEENSRRIIAIEEIHPRLKQ